MADLSPPPLIPTLILVTGGYIAWFAIHYWRDTAQSYPTGPVKSVLTGKGVPAPIREGSSSDPNAQAEGLGTLSNGLASSLAATGAGASIGSLATPSGGSSSTSTSSGVLTQAAVVSLWVENGGAEDQAQFAAGVANAESSYDPNSTSANPDGGTNVGLYQLDTPGGVGAGHTIEELKDPVLNTRITIMATRNGTDWADWADPYITAHGTHGAGG
jgi:hypothetical protein